MTFKTSDLHAYFVAGTQDIPGGDLMNLLKTALDAGITAFQFRDKGNSRLNKHERYQLGQKLDLLCQDYHVPFIVDDDLEMALSLNAEGIHVGQKDLAIEHVLEAASDKMFVGLSCSNLPQVKGANLINDIAYYGCGPVFPTQSKDDADPALGIDGLTDLVHASDRPVVAIGGIGIDTLQSIKETGAKGVAVISLITQSNDINTTVGKINQVFGER